MDKGRLVLEVLVVLVLLEVLDRNVGSGRMSGSTSLAVVLLLMLSMAAVAGNPSEASGGCANNGTVGIVANISVGSIIEVLSSSASRCDMEWYSTDSTLE